MHSGEQHHRPARHGTEFVLAIFAITLVAGGCRWTGYGFDDANSRNNRYETKLGDENVGDLRKHGASTAS